jgi:ABC-2 family transporter protein
MRPYLAVLKDSFREALASRILWLLTGLISLVLFVGLAPFTLREEAAARFQRNEFRNGQEFLKLLAAQAKSPAPSPARRIWSRLSEPLRVRLQTLSPDNLNEQANTLNGVRDDLNGMLNNDDLYDPAIWKPKDVPGEARNLIDRAVDRLPPEEKQQVQRLPTDKELTGNSHELVVLAVQQLSYEEKRRLNRLLIDAAFPEHILPAPGKALYANWFGYRLGAPLPFEPKQLTLLVNFALFELTSFLAGILGVLIAILVTAPTVPQTFEPGAIDLLLSKPVSRSLLFLTKFFGASTFILINAIYLIGGMWLIAGLRFDIWSGKLLLCIPVLLFLFVIYYSVSALAGVIWRNAVVSVCCTVVFWGLCFAVGTLKNVAESAFLNPTRLSAILPAGEKLLAVNRGGHTFEWSAARSGWEEVFRGPETGGSFFFRERMLGPIYDPKADRLCAIESTPTRFDFFGGAGKLLIGPRREDWRRMESAVSPSGPQAMFVDPRGRIVVVGLFGIYRYEGNADVEHRAFKVLGVDLARNRSGQFVRMGPATAPKWQRPLVAAMKGRDGSLAVVSRGKLSVLVPNAADQYVEKKERDLGVEQGSAVAFAGSQIVVALPDGRLRIFSGESLDEQGSIKLPDRAKPRALAASPDGQWLAVLLDNHSLRICDLEGRAPLSAQITGQGDITTAVFSPTNELLASDGFGRVTRYHADTFEPVEAFSPSMDALEALYRYLITPLYTIFPKPGELDSVVSYLVVGDPVDLFNQDRRSRDELSGDRNAAVDIWRPIWSNLAFLTAMLTITCVYISRRDF